MSNLLRIPTYYIQLINYHFNKLTSIETEEEKEERSTARKA